MLLKQAILENSNLKPRQMDIHNNFFIIYYGLNEIYVYEIQNYIDLIYKMRLPLYEQFSGFMFNNF